MLVRVQLMEYKNSILNPNRSSSSMQSGHVVENHSGSSVIHRKMPTIAIPKFGGKHSDWISYRDLFKSLVVDQPINDIEKFSYLRESLSNNPFVIIKNIAVSESNFTIVWEKLVTSMTTTRPSSTHTFKICSPSVYRIRS